MSHAYPPIVIQARNEVFEISIELDLAAVLLMILFMSKMAIILTTIRNILNIECGVRTNRARKVKYAVKRPAE